jgi:hypothetical protein
VGKKIKNLTGAEVTEVQHCADGLRASGYLPASEIGARLEGGMLRRAGVDVLQIVRHRDWEAGQLGMYVPEDAGRIEVAPFGHGRALRIEVEEEIEKHYQEGGSPVSKGWPYTYEVREATAASDGYPVHGDSLRGASDPWFPAWLKVVSHSLPGFKQAEKVVALLVADVELRTACDSAFRLDGQGAVTELLKVALLGLEGATGYRA